jgi:hypothetical protein
MQNLPNSSDDCQRARWRRGRNGSLPLWILADLAESEGFHARWFEEWPTPTATEALLADLENRYN